MQSLMTVWRFLLLASLFAFPQLLGVLLYFRLTRVPRWFATIAATLAPAIFFFWFTRMLFIIEFRESSARSNGCGMPALFAAFALLAGTTIHLVLGLITQAVLYRSRRRASTNSQ